MKSAVSFLFILIINGCIPFLYGQPGAVDTTFATGGYFTYTYEDGGFTRLAIQPDNKILGSCYFNFNITRQKPDGALDPSFAGGMFHGLEYSGSFVCYDLKVQPDGKILAVGGKQYDYILDIYHGTIIRLTSTGTLDTAFGTGGVVVHTDGPEERVYTSVAVQNDQKILVGGFTENASGTYSVILCRLHHDGSYDGSFGNSGKVILDIQGGSAVDPELLLLNDGKIVVSAINQYTGVSHAVLVRLNSNGTVDSTFADNGTLVSVPSVHKTPWFNNHFSQQSDGKFVFAGCTTVNLTEYGIILRFSPDGFPDSTFGSAGSVILDSVPGFFGAVNQPDHKIIAGLGGYRMVRINENGTVDTSFGQGGYMLMNVFPGASWEQMYSLVLQHGGKIITGGVSEEMIPKVGLFYHYAMTRNFSGLNCPVPTAGFTNKVNDSCVQFKDISTSATSWQWDFGDSLTSTDQNPVHYYTNQGHYYVCLQITDTCGSSSFCDTVDFCDHVKTSFSQVVDGLNVVFTDSSNHANSWHWDFGDGQSSNVQNPDHLYAGYGEYYVCLRATNECNAEIKCDSVIVKPNSIGEIARISVRVIPNPARNSFQLAYNSVQSGRCVLQILDMKGVIMRDEEILNPMEQINIKDLVPGLYQVRIILPEQTFCTKFIKL
ncbi:MAG TPA: PKD domain-containing protein [Bacteroidales bacterium]|nr:PKD domain-containing protein [Bacteroidales bacterium]